MRNITKIRRSIRAISPVISILLMIAIAVVASIVAYAWVMGYLGFQTEKAGNQIQLQSWTSQDNLIIYVQNTGQGTVHLKQDSSVYVNDVLKNILKADNRDVEPKELIPITVGQTVKVEVDYQNFRAGDRVKVVTVEGTFIQTTGNSGSGHSSGGFGGPGFGPFTITPMAEAGGSISPNTPQQIPAGGSISFTVEALQGYHIDNVYVDGSPVTLDGENKYTFSNVQENHDIHAVFAGDSVQNRYTITVTQTPNGIINPGTSTYDVGATPSFTITPANGYQIASITANGQTIPVTSPSGQTYKFNAVTGAGTLTATYSAVGQQTQYTITVTQTDHGTITPGTITIAAGASQQFTITPDSNYQIASIVANGVSQTITSPTGQTYTFTTVSGPCTLTATYTTTTQNQYTITVIQTPHGTISPDTTTVAAGSSKSFTITPDSGYHIASITANGIAQAIVTPAGQTYTFSSVSAPCTLTATYEANSQSRIVFNTGFDGNPWDQGWNAGSNPPFYKTATEGVGETAAAKSDPYNTYVEGRGYVANDGAFTSNEVNTNIAGANTITITYMYKVHLTEASDLKIAYSTIHNPNLNPGSSDFHYVGNIGDPAQDDVWYQGSYTILKSQTPSAFTSSFSFRFESALDLAEGGDYERVWVDNIIITVS